ncbi:MAG: sulfatase-like hydrolase/transferase [Ardenticatenaceae bacterium]|nr:sulfatase-like hydrolase/transferase [Anaerolineales bacterium]MCB8977761.1 sulfatase-like hydrolase/transferase [Ardenticatenaceae bacterium]
MTKAPNILLFLTDDHAQWAMGCAGNSELCTPTFDYLAQNGTRFANAFTPIPVCSPARACLLTGRLASQHGIHDYLASGDPEVNNISWLANETTLAQLFQAAGYQTGQFGKWHLGQDEFAAAGYDEWFSLGRDYPIPHGGPFRYGVNGRFQTLSGRISHNITEHAVDFLRERDSERPFFMTVGYYATHSPWEGQSERLAAAYRNATFADVPLNEMYPFGIQNLESTNETRHQPREALAQYYAAVTEIDTAVGRLIDELESLGQLENTIVIYTSDHGLNTGHHGIWGKGNGTLPLNMVEESIRVPLIWYDGRSPGSITQPARTEFVDHLDTFLTILDVAGIAPPDKNYVGRTYQRLLHNQTIPEWRAVQFGEYGNVRMLRTSRHKLVSRYPDGPHELFDLVADPREMNNVIDRGDMQPIVQAFVERLDGFFTRYEDPAKSGLRVRDLPRHNTSEAWRTG